MAILWIVLGVLFILINRVLIRWYFEIEKRNRYNEAQIRLLTQIALSSGVEPDNVNRVVSEAKLPSPEMNKKSLWI